MNRIVAAGLCAVLITGPALADDAASVDLQTKELALEKARVDLQKDALSATPGTAQVSPGGGAAEEYILADQKIDSIAGQVANDVNTACGTSNYYLIYTNTDMPTQTDRRTYDAQKARLDSGLIGAEAAYAKAQPPNKSAVTGDRSVAALLPEVGLALTVMSLLKTDYTLGGDKLDPDQQELTYAVAGKLQGGKLIYYSANFSDSDKIKPVLDALAEEVGKLQVSIQTAAGEAGNATARAKALESSNKDVSVLYTEAAGQLNAYVTDAKTYLSFLLTPDAKGSTPMLRVAQERTLSSDNACLFTVRIHHEAGSHYTKSNLFTFFGGMPFYASASVTASLSVWDKDGAAKKTVLYYEKGKFQSFNEIYTSNPTH